MLIPGYVTDGIGLLLFIPGLRTVAGMFLLQWVAKKPHFSSFVNFGGSAETRKRQADQFGLTNGLVIKMILMMSLKASLKSGQTPNLH